MAFNRLATARFQLSIWSAQTRPARACVWAYRPMRRQQQQQQQQCGFHSMLTSSLLFPNVSRPCPAAHRSPDATANNITGNLCVKANWNSSNDGTKRSCESTALRSPHVSSVFAFPNLYHQLSHRRSSHVRSTVVNRVAKFYLQRTLFNCCLSPPLDIRCILTNKRQIIFWTFVDECTDT